MFLPYENITYVTKLESKEVLERINEIIEPKMNFRMPGDFGSGAHEPYEGNISGNSFKINRIIEYRNIFLPRIEGRIEKEIGKTRIIVKMRLHKYVQAFLLGYVLLIFLLMFLKDSSDSMMNTSLFMLLFGYVSTIVSFKYESRESKELLAYLFEAE